MNFEFDKANAQARAQRIRQEAEAQQKAAEFRKSEMTEETVITERATESEPKRRFRLRFRPQQA